MAATQHDALTMYDNPKERQAQGLPRYGNEPKPYISDAFTRLQQRKETEAVPNAPVIMNPERIQIRRTEKDPSGIDAHTPGAKLDAGKVRPALVLRGFARALLKVCEVGTFGAVKYTDNGWVEVPNGEARYADAQLRHFLKEAIGEECDPDSNLEHLAHEAWNALAKLDLALRRKEQEAKKRADEAIKAAQGTQ